MQKLQELITKHKENLRDWKRVKAVLCDDWVIIYEIITNKIYSLSDLLFSTPFLSLLEWKETSKEWQKWEHFYGIVDCEWRKDYSETWYNFHKINLALLESDKERVEYIESFTL